MNGITAAAVGVLINLAVFFAYHVFAPNGADSPLSWSSIVIGAVAAVALFRFKVGIIPVVLGSGVAGLVLALR